MRRALGLCLCATAVGAAALPSASERVISIGDDATLRLEQTGPAVFADVACPDEALAQAWLTAHLLQQPLGFKTTAADRYGRALIASDAEAAMLRDGAAVAYSTNALPAKLLEAEAVARHAKRGLWQSPLLILTPEEAANHLQQFHLVEGTVRHAYYGKSATYLNFGGDWRSDFSAMIPGRNRRGFVQLDAVKAGSRIRVRGVITQENGPMIRLSRPEQLELL